MYSISFQFWKHLSIYSWWKITKWFIPTWLITQKLSIQISTIMIKLKFLLSKVPKCHFRKMQLSNRIHKNQYMLLVPGVSSGEFRQTSWQQVIRWNYMLTISNQQILEQTSKNAQNYELKHLNYQGFKGKIRTKSVKRKDT